nr:hypothetical protein [Tanacetum cinerariifolium]
NLGLNLKQWETLLQMLKNGSGSIVKMNEPIIPSVNENEYNDTRLHEEPPSQDRGNELVNEETTVHDNQTVRDDDTLSSPQSLNVEEQIQEENLGRGHRKKKTSDHLRDYVTNTVNKKIPSRSTPPAQSRSSDLHVRTHYARPSDKVPIA